MGFTVQAIGPSLPPRLAAVLVAVLALLALATACDPDPGPGQVAPREPLQVELKNPVPIHSEAHEGYEILPIATYDIEARVLSVETYRWDQGAELAPIDLALGWGPMSDVEVLRHFDIGQGYRLFTWRTREFPIPREDVESHSANVHVIAAYRSVESQVRQLRPGDVVRLQGSLVEARAKSGWTWRSSLTRQDTGNGSCELFWVESVQVR